MNKQIHPAVLAVVAVVVIALLSVWGYHAVQPAAYLPSPGAGGRPGVTANEATADGGHPAGYYPTPPARRHPRQRHSASEQWAEPLTAR